MGNCSGEYSAALLDPWASDTEILQDLGSQVSLEEVGLSQPGPCFLRSLAREENGGAWENCGGSLQRVTMGAGHPPP